MSLKILNKEELKALDADIFTRYPKAQKVSVTSDGTVFITDESDNAVKNHSKNNRYKKELEITPFTRDGLEGTNTSNRAEDIIAAITASQSVDEVEALKAAEVAGKNRKSVVQAADARVNELKAQS